MVSEVLNGKQEPKAGDDVLTAVGSPPKVADLPHISPTPVGRAFFLLGLKPRTLTLVRRPAFMQCRSDDAWKFGEAPSPYGAS